MRLSSPTKKVFWATIIIACVALVAFIVSFFAAEVFGVVAFLLMLIAFVVLVLGAVLKGF